MQATFLTRLAPKCQSGILQPTRYTVTSDPSTSMKIEPLEPLKIPAFMRKKSLIRKDNSNFYKASKETLSPAPSAPERSRIRFTSPMSVPIISKTRRSQPHIAPQLSFEEPFEPMPEMRRTRVEPTLRPVAPRIVEPEPVFTPVGVVTHYLDKISVAIIKLDADVKVGDRLVLNGEKGPFRQKLSSMQINRQNVEMAGRGDDIGIKVNKKATVGEIIYVIG